MLTYTWKLTNIKKTSNSTLSNVIIQTYWQVTGTDEDGLEGTFSGATPFDISKVDSENFIAWNNLTEETVLGWIKEQVVGGYKEHIDQQMQKQIDSKKNVVVEVSGNDFPWAPAANTANTANT
jgi:hypothetical protein